MSGWIVVFAMATAQQPPAMSDAELSQYLTTVRAQIADPGIDLGRREGLAVDLAGTLDRAAQASADPELRRNRWGEAIAILDRFVRENPDLGTERQLRLQAAVFRWAQAQTWVQAASLEPSNPRHRDRAVALLEDAIERLKAVSALGDHTTLGDNLRYRLAQALADRAGLEPAGTGTRKAQEDKAMELLAQPATELGLAGFWHLLKAELLLRAGKTAEAGGELDAALAAKPAPPEPEIHAVKIPLLIARKQFAQALSAVESSHLERALKGLWNIRVRLAELGGTPPGEERRKLHAELFREVLSLKGTQAPEARFALLELARAGVEPEASAPAEAWDAMADAYQASGDMSRAATAETRAADAASAAGQAQAAAGYRLRAGAYFYQASRFLQADAALTRVADDPTAGSIRPRAGMLRALARGRAAALRLPGSSVAAYTEALERQIRDFPDHPSTAEARWLLGELEASTPSHLARARSLWEAIPPESPRWLDSRLAIAARDLDDLDRQLINPDRGKLAATFEKADAFLVESTRQARSEEATARLLLARARLNLVPVVTRGEVARDLCDRVNGLPVSQVARYRARLLRMIALVDLSRYVDAEREAQTHPDWDLSSERAAFFDAVRLLDQSATAASTDLRQRRLGLILKLLLESVLTLDQKFESVELVELKMRMTRALLFIGDDIDARRSLSSWKGTPDTSSDRILRDLGDTYSRLQVYSLDLDVQRLRLQNNPAGSMPWFDARYALALAYYHSGQHKEAAQLIDATAILHPELGGGELHEKFIRLRQRLGEKE